jgi:hypothetical protein
MPTTYVPGASVLRCWKTMLSSVRPVSWNEGTRTISRRETRATSSESGVENESVTLYSPMKPAGSRWNRSAVFGSDNPNRTYVESAGPASIENPAMAGK